MTWIVWWFALGLAFTLGYVVRGALLMGEGEPPDIWPRDRLTCWQCGKTDGTHLSDCGWRPGEV